jgi:hypothetical protein
VPVLDVGDWRVPTLTVSPHDGTTSAALTITAPDGTTTSPTPSTTDSGATWTAPGYQLDQAGQWVERWTVTGTGAGSERLTVEVAADPATAISGSYATVAQLTAYPVTVPAGVDAVTMLRRASRDVDRALMTAVYDVDDAGLPTDATVAAALRDATCEQVAGNLDSGDRTGSGATVPATGFTIGKIQVQRGGGTGGGQQADRIDGLWPQAYAILRRAGLTGQAVQSW